MRPWQEVSVGFFDDLHDYAAIPRLTGLKLAPGGGWLAATVQETSPDGKKYVQAIWRIPVQADGTPGAAGPARLTRSAEGEGGPEFLPDGSLLFVSKRPDPAAARADGDEVRRPAVWLLPAGGGEARRIATLPGGITAVAAAASAPELLFVAPMLAGADGADEDAKRREARKNAGVAAILHEAGGLRYWDHDLGPDEPRLLAVAAGPGGLDGEPRDLTPAPGRALDEQHAELAPDGSLAVTGWAVWERGEVRYEVVAIDTGTGARRTLLAAADADFTEPRISPDGRQVVCRREGHETYQAPGDVTLVAAALDGSGGPADLLPDLDRWPQSATWAPDSRAVYFTADDRGRCPVYRVETASGAVTRLTTDDAAYSDLCPSPDGRYLYALRSAIGTPPAPVRIDLSAPGLPPLPLPSPAPAVTVPGEVAEITADADDGTVIRGWLVLPPAASARQPAPLLLWVHGGPHASWNAWSWRWNPWLMAARGYAVLLPDPALSTGYGLGFIARGHGTWGPRPYADLMAITDAAAARPDIDASRTAMMGGSYGGYMANWIAGQTSRFRAIVSHAGLWALDQMFGTTDLPAYWRRHFGDPLARPERYLANSPHRNAGQIRTPMLVIHGDKDYRVPVAEALRLWADLSAQLAPEAAPKFLYFPDENHWILTPGHAVVWYETVLAFLAQHVLGEPWHRPGLL
jgi:dipeptidyl aminopeptidase/acylaminoacyl peptidase